MRATLLPSVPRSEESFIKKKIHRNRQHAPSAGIICFSWFSGQTLGRIASILKDFSKICSMAIEWCIHLCSELKDKTGIKLGVTEVDVAALQNGLNKWKRSGRILFFLGSVASFVTGLRSMNHRACSLLLLGRPKSDFRRLGQKLNSDRRHRRLHPTPFCVQFQSRFSFIFYQRLGSWLWSCWPPVECNDSDWFSLDNHQ